MEKVTSYFCAAFLTVIPLINTANSQELSRALYNYTKQSQPGKFGKMSGRVVSLQFNKDANKIAIGDVSKSLKVFDLRNSKLLWSKSGNNILPVSMADVWPLNMLMSAQGEFDGAKIKGYDWDTGKEKGSLGPFGGGRNGLAFHSIKAQLAWTGPQTKFYRFDLLNNEFLESGDAKHIRPAYSIKFSPDGKSIYSASPDKTVIKIDSETKTSLTVFKANHPIIDIAIPFQREAELLAIGENRGAIHFMNMVSRKFVKTLSVPDGAVSNLSYHPKSADLLIITGKTHLYFLQISTGKIVYEIDTGDEIFALSIAENAERIATGHESGAVNFYYID